MYQEIIGDMENLFISTGILPPKPLPLIHVADED
jgi:hypothetical protein